MTSQIVLKLKPMAFAINGVFGRWRDRPQQAWRIALKADRIKTGGNLLHG